MASESDFCAEMRQKTKDIHDKSDRLVNLKLAVALTDTKVYAGVLSDFYFVFQAIESCLDVNKSHPHIGPMTNPKMLRAASFEKDLEFYLGEGWRGQVTPSEPARLYCERIMKIADQDPTLLIAYVHSMYLALVAGGQMIKKIVKKTLGLSQAEGLAIFEFEDINRTALRKHIYSSINELDLDRVRKDAIIAEKIRVFQMNNAIASAIKPSVKSFTRLTKLIVLFIVFMGLLAVLISFMLQRVIR